MSAFKFRGAGGEIEISWHHAWIRNRRIRDGMSRLPIDRGGYEFEAPTRFDELFLGVGVETEMEVGYAGTERIGPDDTFDADYRRVLEAVQNRGKVLASPRGIALMWTLGIQGKPQVAG